MIALGVLDLQVPSTMTVTTDSVVAIARTASRTGPSSKKRHGQVISVQALKIVELEVKENAIDIWKFKIDAFMALTVPSSDRKVVAPHGKEIPHDLHPDNLHRLAARIRDDLDPKVAQEGPNVLSPDEVLEIHTLLIHLKNWPVPAGDLRASRIHLAVSEISGKATRWPKDLA